MHLSLGGLRLVDFSSGKPEAALDRQVNRQAAFAGKKATPSPSFCEQVAFRPLGLTREIQRAWWSNQHMCQGQVAFWKFAPPTIHQLRKK